MKKVFQQLMFGAAIVLLATGFSSCSNDNDGDELTTDEQYLLILDEYVTSTIVPTYKSLAEAALKMRTANEALKNNPTNETMKAASDAWMEARVAWEKSEAFLFGPVGDQALDIDGHIDSWPLEKEEIDKVLANEAAGLTGRIAWRDLDAEVIGFHVTEYLLYREGKSRPAADLTTAELKYLTAATDALVWDCVLAYVAWVGVDNVPSEMKSVFNENPDVVAHLNNNPNYKNFAHTLKTASGIYASNISDALKEIAVGASEIAGEVGATKIAAPYEGHKVEDVESWYSWHSLDDYQNNIHSIKNAYLGGMNDNSRKANSLSSYIASRNAQLDSQVKAKIDDCLKKIADIGKGGKSFYEVVRDQTNKVEVEAAVAACIELQQLFEKLLNDVIE